jgi:signal transduction histidine kinase
MGNEILFIRMISNLLNNALHQIKQNRRGEVFISQEDGEKVNILQVKDTAGGISSKLLEHIFTGYHTTKEEGTGIGLAFCKHTIKSFGGDIRCNSVEGYFTEFVLSFPKI